MRRVDPATGSAVAAAEQVHMTIPELTRPSHSYLPDLRHARMAARGFASSSVGPQRAQSRLLRQYLQSGQPQRARSRARSGRLATAQHGVTAMRLGRHPPARAVTRTGRNCSISSRRWFARVNCRRGRVKCAGRR